MGIDDFVIIVHCRPTICEPTVRPGRRTSRYARRHFQQVRICISSMEYSIDVTIVGITRCLLHLRFSSMWRSSSTRDSRSILFAYALYPLKGR